MCVDTLAIGEFEGHTVLIRKCSNYKEVAVMTGPNTGMVAESFLGYVPETDFVDKPSNNYKLDNDGFAW